MEDFKFNQHIEGESPIEGKSPIEGESPIEGDELGIFLEKRVLFHGSSNPHISQFMTAEEASDANIRDGVTVGEGLYLTSSKKAADAYARIRTDGEQLKEEVAPTTYEVLVDNLRLLDLRNNVNIATFARKFYVYLRSILNDTEAKKKLHWMTPSIIFDALKEIDSGVSLRNIQKISGYGMAGIFTNYVKQQGYDGIVTLEGGEGRYDESPTNTGDHDSYIIFNPDKALVLKKRTL